jgi:RNA polymerase sigma-70 factor (ECF subfamily)
MPTAFQIAFPAPALTSGQETTARQDLFAALVRRQSRFVFRVAYSVLRNSHDSEDVVQETFLKIYRSSAWERLRDERAFLARAAWRLALDRLRKAPLQTSDFDLASAPDNPEQTAIAVDSETTLHRLIDSLPNQLRLPLALSAVEDLKSSEIAAIMGIPEGTVRRRLMRARQILKQKLLSVKAGPHAK